MHTHYNIRCVLILVFSMLGCALYAQSDLKVNLSFTSNSQFISDWKSGRQAAMLTIINTGKSDRDFKVETELYYEGTLVAKTDVNKMPVTTVNAGGTLRVSAEEFYPVNAVNYYGKFNVNDVITSGKVPPGLFQFCTKLVDVKTGSDLTVAQCKTFNVTEYTLTVVSPVNTATVTPTEAHTLNFQWVTAPAYQGIVEYEVKGFEIFAGQTYAEAVNGSPVFDITVKNRQSVRYTPDLVPLEPGKRYAWYITATNENGQSITEKERSETFVFSVANGFSGTQKDILYPNANVSIACHGHLNDGTPGY